MTQSTARKLLTSVNSKDWRDRSICGSGLVDPDVWWDPDHPGKRKAKHICLNHCPVILDCQKNYRPSGGETAGGVCYRQDGEPMKPQPMAARNCLELCEDPGS